MIRLDLHTHTTVGSDDARMEPEELIRRAKELGLRGVAITEHDMIWPRERFEALQAQTDLLLVRGVEVNTEIGHVLVYGWDDEMLWPYRQLKALSERARAIGAVLVVAHPLRKWASQKAISSGMKLPSLSELLKLERWGWVDGIEGWNGKSTDMENVLALNIAHHTGHPITGGSDAHHVEQVGASWTEFLCEVRTQQDVVEAIRNRKVAWGKR